MTTTSNPKVSVLIDTYNHEAFIERAIRSVLEQDLPMHDVEIVVVDDGSTDGTPDIVHSFEPRVRLIRKPNGGQGSAFNAGIPECSGEIVAFLDGDDWWAAQKLRLVLEAMKAHPEVGIVGNGIIEVLESGDERSETLLESRVFRIDSVQGARLFRRRKSQMGTSRMTVRMEVLLRILPVPESLMIEADEYIFTLAAAFSVASIVAEPLTYYRIHAGNLFQVSGFKTEALLRKQKSIDSLARALSERLSALGLDKETVTTVAEAVQLEADLLRLQLEGGSSWEMVRAEWRFYRIVHEDGTLPHLLFKLATLLPALFCPPRLYYGARRRLAASQLYIDIRKVFFPVPEPRHTSRSRREAS